MTFLLLGSPICPYLNFNTKVTTHRSQRSGLFIPIYTKGVVKENLTYHTIEGSQRDCLMEFKPSNFTVFT